MRSLTEGPGTRFDRRAIAFALLGLALIASATLLAYWGRGQALGGDELHYAIRLSTQSLGHAMLYPPPDGYLIAAPLLVYKALFETAGLGAYGAHLAVAITLVLTCALLFYALAQMVGAGNLIALMFGLPYEWAVLCVGTVMLAYVLFGGMIATTWVQIIKAILLLCGVSLLTALVMSRFDFSFGALY